MVDPCFESAIVKVLNEEFRTLTTTEVQRAYAATLGSIFKMERFEV